MNLVAWIIFGLISGIIAYQLDRKPVSGGVLGAILLGVLGSVLGGILANLLLGIDIGNFSLTSLVIAVTGSLLLLFINRTLQKA